ncbi:MAG: PhnD/SsuA/transferrin family substrate-binding protein [Deltaproteobacteria bacterium]|nr:PhnD/SsuA/transferrin family substrate-binding protein [Deltaproteobacteria bacterium]
MTRNMYPASRGSYISLLMHFFITKCCNIALTLLLSVLMFWALPGRAAAEQNNVMPTEFRAGFLQAMFHNVDPRDVKAILNMNSLEISGMLTQNLPTRVVMYPDAAALDAAVRRGELEMVSMMALDYLRSSEATHVIPAFVTLENNGLGVRFALITRIDSGIHSLADLKGKSLLLPPIYSYETGHLWLEVLLLKGGNGERDSFFGKVKEVPKASAALIAVFFRQADAALVNVSSFNTSRELNPQLDTQLTVLVESPYLLNEMVCLPPNTPEHFRSDLINAMIRFNETSKARQLYTILQTSGITRFKPAYLEGVENLYHEYRRLKATTTLKK